MSTQQPGLQFTHALSNHADPASAARHIAEQLDAVFEAPPDLLIIHASGDHAYALGDLTTMLVHETEARHTIGCSAAGVIAGAVELENRRGVAVLAARLPETTLTPLASAQLEAILSQDDPASALASALPKARRHAATLMFADPFTTPITGLIGQLSQAHRPARPQDHDTAPVLLGGIASSAEAPGGNTLVLDGEATHEGAVALALSGGIVCDIAVSQGCRPIGPDMRVTRAKGNLILGLNDRPALEAVRRVVHSVSESDRKLLAGGLFLGRAIHENKAHLGRGDYLIRNVVGADEDSGGVAVAEIVPEGSTVRLHFRDATTATEDLELLLDAQQLYGTPAGALLVTCNGRGERFFGKQNKDAVTVQRAFLPAESGSEAAKAGRPISPPDAPVPLAGFFAAGEIGPIGGQAFLHGYTACLACFRKDQV